MTRRYLALFKMQPGSATTRFATFAERLHRIASPEIAFENDEVLIATSANAVVRLNEHGLIIGTVFERDGVSETRIFSDEEAARIASSRGQRLMDDYWGPYVAIIRAPGTGRIDIVRAPLGEMPCYFIQIDDVLAVTSDVDLLVECGLYTPHIDWSEIARHLVFRDLHDRRTCLAGVCELAGGERLSVAERHSTVETLWSPWDMVGDWETVDLYESCERIHGVASRCIGARASTYDKVVLMLSGGLDSSIVATCLAAQGVPVQCLNLVTDDAIGDERDYARRVCDVLGLDLTEAFRDVARIDVTRSGATRLPRPTVRSFIQESNRLAGEAAVAGGAEAIFNGGGGDNVFCSLQSAGPAADRLLVAGPGAGFFSTARDISIVAQASVWAVLSDAFKRAWLGKPALKFTPDLSLLSIDPGTLTQMNAPHPWLRIPARALPGKAMHVRLLAYAQSFIEASDPRAPIPSVSPLLAQPLVEACLRVPSWCWFDGGRNRSVARRAFAADLPREIIDRRSKGTPDSFVAQIYETHRAAIRALLNDGELAQRGIIDAQAVLGVLDDRRPAKGDAFRRILQFADIEAWVQAWSGSTR